MSTVREQLQAQLSRYDDDAFAALANRGLLRRAYKDLESHAPTIVNESDEALHLAFAGQEVRFDLRGPAQAQCSCPASGVCQHMLGAAIGLRRLLEESSAGSEQRDTVEPNMAPIAEPAASAVPSNELLRDALLAMSYADLLKHAGKAGYRWAWQCVQDLEPEQDIRLSGERNIVIELMRPRMSFRYMGGALDSLIVDTQTAQVAKYRVAAVLAFQRAHGIALREPDAPGKLRNAELDLGKDHALAQTGVVALLDSRTRLHVAVRDLLQECIALGLSHLSEAVQQRYATLAVWAQGAEYYRLALLLRRLADHVELLLDRAGNADEHTLLDEISLAFGLILALGRTGAHGPPAHLVGRARTRYEAAGTLELLGLGASAWRSASGYIGLTMLFWSPADRTFLSCTDARPESQGGFNPVARYKAAGPWGGLGAPAQATGRRLLLTNAQLNAAGRLSAAEHTNVAVQQVAAHAFLQQLQPAANWQVLRQARQLQQRSLLAEARPMNDWVVLQPSRIGAAHFDSTRQVLIWPVYDETGDGLMIELPYSPYTEHAIARIEQLAGRTWFIGDLLLVRLRDGATGTIGEPLSIIKTGMADDANPVDALHFDAGPAPDALSEWLNKSRRPPSHPGADRGQSGRPSASPERLRSFRHWLRRQAERGTGAESAIQLSDELSGWQSRLVAAGLTAFGGLSEKLDVTARLLAANYVCMQCERMIDGSDGSINF
ncbi:hypothetical protein [Dyella sp. GSA-30]|uniref:hypothetical protein n=1 Tax=Dyella sp. GSA-30 TaxID=2994496 RepID=UPI00249051D1|nr:hypothetical protein [Dyella sp. GSA-30]BDU20053.1 hypothetical protein DYGSA30_15100 [Dyella sp. GSA-30]